MLLYLLLIMAVANAKVQRLELENFQGAGTVISRSNAFNGNVVHLTDGSIIRYEMCVHSPIDVVISNIYFSNDADNKGDVISVFVDGNLIGSFRSEEQMLFSDRSEWNNIRSSGQIGDNIRLDYGRHMLTLQVTEADAFGIELDALDLDTGNTTISNPDFVCDVYCFHDINFNTSSTPKGVNGFKIRQLSKHTVCAEEENVKVAFYHETADNFEIKATRPRYSSCANYRDPDFRGCKLASPAWNFLDVPLHSDATVVMKQARASLTVDNTETLVRVAVAFDMSGFSITRGQGESRTAGRVFVVLGNLTTDNPVNVSLTYKGKSGRLVTSGDHTFDIENPSHIWEIPDDTWDYNEGNNIILSMRSELNDYTNLFVKEFKLEKRPMSTRAFTIADDGIFVFQGIQQEPKWLKQTAMSIKLPKGNGDQVFEDVSSLRLYMKKPYDDGYSQIFVLNDDGHSRIQPVTSHGMDWTPFGSSIIIGPNKADNIRPFASIKSINLNPSNLRMKVNYNDGSSLVLRIIASPSYTIVRLIRYKFADDKMRSEHAILTFLSTWIQDGYAYADRFAVDGVEKDSLVRSFNDLIGTKANFYRRCISRLNTQSPDIEIFVRRDTGDNFE